MFLSEKPALVDRGCSPHQFIGQCLNVGDITSDKLTDLCASEDGNRQLALLLIKNEVRNDGSYDRRVNVYSSPPPFLVLFFVLHINYVVRDSRVHRLRSHVQGRIKTALGPGVMTYCRAPHIYIYI